MDKQATIFISYARKDGRKLELQLQVITALGDPYTLPDYGGTPFSRPVVLDDSRVVFLRWVGEDGK